MSGGASGVPDAFATPRVKLTQGICLSRHYFRNKKSMFICYDLLQVLSSSLKTDFNPMKRYGYFADYALDNNPDTINTGLSSVFTQNIEMVQIKHTRPGKINIKLEIGGL